MEPEVYPNLALPTPGQRNHRVIPKINFANSMEPEVYPDLACQHLSNGDIVLYTDLTMSTQGIGTMVLYHDLTLGQWNHSVNPDVTLLTPG